MSDAVDWNLGDKSCMVSIGSHKLYLSASGQDRKPREPAILLMQGLGSTISEWVAVKRLVQSFARWIEYDRSGLGKSEVAPQQPQTITAVSVASELDVLLKTAGMEGPFIVVCHSWGGMTSREFLYLRPKDIVGMVFVDANTEKSFDGGNWPLPCVTAVTHGLSWLEHTGLEAENILSDQEWAEMKREREDPQFEKTEAAEANGWKTDGPTLAAKRQIENQALGGSLVSVIKSNTGRDMQRMYDAGVSAGLGTEAEREEYREFLREFDRKWTGCQMELLKLSSSSRFTKVDDAGHNLQMLQPAVIAKQIRWVWDAVRHQV